MKCMAWGKAWFLYACLDQQTRVQFNTVLDFREKHLVRPGWCVTVKRCCCCENPPGSPLAKIYWLAPVYFDSVIPGPHWQLLLLSSDPLGCWLTDSVSCKPWPDPGRGRITTVCWAVTPAPARSRSWRSTGSGPRRATQIRWGTLRNSRFVRICNLQ